MAKTTTTDTVYDIITVEGGGSHHPFDASNGHATVEFRQDREN